MNIQELLEVIDGIAEVEVKELNEKEALIFLPEYQLHYRLHINDVYFVKALDILFTIEINNFKSNFKKDIKVFSADDLLEFRTALREDINKLGGVYESYFFDENGIVKKEVDKRYLLDYVTFINRAFFS